MERKGTEAEKNNIEDVMKKYVIDIKKADGAEVEAIETAKDIEAAVSQVILYNGDTITGIREIPSEDIVDIDEE